MAEILIIAAKSRAAAAAKAALRRAANAAGGRVLRIDRFDAGVLEHVTANELDGRAGLAEPKAGDEMFLVVLELY